MLFAMKQQHSFWIGLALATAASVGWARPVWRAAQPDAQSVVFALGDGASLRVDVLAENLFRVRRSWTNENGKAVWTESGMNRYGILRGDWPKVAFTREKDGVRTAAARVAVDAAGGTLRVKSLVSAADLTVAPRAAGKGYAISFSLAKGERIYGLGDASRDNLMRRGHRFDVWIRNNLCNIPVPMAVSRNGWGVFLNSTWRNAFDVGAKVPDALVCEAPEGDVDFYLFVGKDYRALLERNAAGLPPKGADAVCIVARTPDDTLLMIREFRYPLNSWCIAFPAGLVDEDESLFTCADRELREETGYGVVEGTDVRPLPQAGYSSTGMSDETVQVVFVEAEKVADAHPEPNELIEVFELPIADVRTFLDENQLPIGTRAQLILESFAQG